LISYPTKEYSTTEVVVKCREECEQGNQEYKLEKYNIQHKDPKNTSRIGKLASQFSLFTCGKKEDCTSVIPEIENYLMKNL
jgi:hypothetical protein